MIVSLEGGLKGGDRIFPVKYIPNLACGPKLHLYRAAGQWQSKWRKNLNNKHSIIGCFVRWLHCTGHVLTALFSHVITLSVSSRATTSATRYDWTTSGVAIFQLFYKGFGMKLRMSVTHRRVSICVHRGERESNSLAKGKILFLKSLTLTIMDWSRLFC